MAALLPPRPALLYGHPLAFPFAPVESPFSPKWPQRHLTAFEGGDGGGEGASQSALAACTLSEEDLLMSTVSSWLDAGSPPFLLSGPSAPTLTCKKTFFLVQRFDDMIPLMTPFLSYPDNPSLSLRRRVGGRKG